MIAMPRKAIPKTPIESVQYDLWTIPSSK